MTARQFITMGVTYAGITKQELAEKLGWTPQRLDMRLRAGKFTIKEWETITRAMGAELKMNFKFPDGREV